MGSVEIEKTGHEMSLHFLFSTLLLAEDGLQGDQRRHVNLAGNVN